MRRYESIVADSARWEGFRFRPGDIVITTPPKCGTTWMQTLVALLVFDGELPEQPLAKVSPWVDMQIAPRDEVFARLEAQTHRRFMKSHTPLDGLPYDERVTYVGVGRDPRDVAVSSRNHMDNLDVDRFMAARTAAVGALDMEQLGDRSRPGPPPSEELTPLQSWIEGTDEQTPMSLQHLVHHLQQLWDRRDDANVGLFHYDDLLTDLAGEVSRLAALLEIDLPPGRAEQIAAVASFSAMKQRAATFAPNSDVQLWRSNERFFNRGISGQWSEVFGADDLERYERRIASLTTPDFAAWLHHD